MIQRSVSLTRRLELDALRYVGSLARLSFYSGEMPEYCEGQASGERIDSITASETIVRDIVQGKEPRLPEGAGYWRLMDNNGNCAMQGDGT